MADPKRQVSFIVGLDVETTMVVDSKATAAIDTTPDATVNSDNENSAQNNQLGSLNITSAIANGSTFLQTITNTGVSAPPPSVTASGSVPSQALQLARVTVFCDTGTVGICRVLNGQVRQTFRRNVNNLDAVERLLRHPPQLTKIDNSLILGDDDDDDDEEDSGTTKEYSIQSQIELAEVGLAILQGEKEKLEQHLTAIKPPSSSTETTPTSDIRNVTTDESVSSTLEESNHTTGTGMEFQFSLPAAAMTHVDQCLHDIHKMGKLIRGVATNGKGTVFLYGNGGVAYTPNIPRPLQNKLSQLRGDARMSSRPSYVSLGTRDRYFVSFNDGSFHAKGPKPLDKELKKLRKAPRSVAFGGAWDTWFIVFHDGSWKCQGRSIPDELEEKLAERGDRPDLVCVNLGPHGEWFLKARNGRLWWGGISDEADSAICELLDAGHDLNIIDFGEGGSYYVSYD